MSAYSKDGRFENPAEAAAASAAPARAGSATPGAESQIRVDGFEQVLAMLKVADPEFRESLLKRLAARDRELAAHLRADLRRAGL